MRKNNKNLLIMFVFLILILNAFSVFSQESVSTNTGNSGGVSSYPNDDKPVSTPASSEYTSLVGNKMTVDSDGKFGNPEDVSIKGGTATPNSFVQGKPDGGKLSIGGKGEVDGKKDVNLGEKGDVKIKGNEITNAKEGSSIEIDKNGRIEKERIIGSEIKDGKGTDVAIDGKDKKITLDNIPEDAVLSKNTGEKDYSLTMPKEGGKVPMPQVQKKKPEEEDKEGYNPNLNIFSKDSFSELPDEIAAKAGLAKGLSFKTGENGALIFNSQDGNWRTIGKVEFAIPGQAEKLMTINNLGDKFSNANKESVLFFGQDSLNTPEARELFNKGIAGIIIDSNKKSLTSFSTNDKIGAYVELGEKNPFNGYRSSIIPEANSGVLIHGGEKNPNVFIKGNGFFYAGEGAGFKKQGNDLIFKEGMKISDVLGNHVEAFNPSSNYKARVYPLDSSGNYLTTPGKNIYAESSINSEGRIANNVFTLNQQGNPITPATNTRVQGNLPGIDSQNREVISPVTNSIPNAQYLKSLGTIEQNAMSSTVRIKAPDPTGTGTGTGTIIGAIGDKTYILTAGHIMRKSQGKYPVSVEIYDYNSQKIKTVTGQVINYQTDMGGKIADLALVAIPNENNMISSKIVSPYYNPQQKESVFQIGCTKGADPTCRTSVINSINKYLGEQNIQIAGYNEIGRSGGGLFNNQGQLIGVASTSDEKDIESIYSGPKAIQDYLNKLGLSQLYKIIFGF